MEQSKKEEEKAYKDLLEFCDDEDNMEALIADVRPKLEESKGLSDEELSEAIVVGIGACDLGKMPADVLNSFPKIGDGSDETK